MKSQKEEMTALSLSAMPQTVSSYGEKSDTLHTNHGDSRKPRFYLSDVMMSGTKGLLFSWSYWKFGDVKEQLLRRAVATHVGVWLVQVVLQLMKLIRINITTL